jgi:hypothetical protein
MPWKYPPTEIGHKFNRLTASSENWQEGRRMVRYWRCDCGVLAKIRDDAVRSGQTESCGCAQREGARRAGLARKKHQMIGTPEYRAWAKMRERCNNPNVPSWANYGGRGISVCPEWDTFEAFYESVGPRPSPDHSLDRVDTNGDYQPDNCRWASRQEQVRNRRLTRMVTYMGESLPMAELAERVGVKYQSLYMAMVRDGRTAEEAVTRLAKN